MAKKPVSRSDNGERVDITPINIGVMKVTIEGESPLIVHRFSDKAKKQIAEKQGKKATGARKARDPKAEYEAAMYTLPGKPGKHYIKAIAFKCAIVDSASFIPNLTKVILRGAVFVTGDKANPAYVEIKGSKPHMATDTVRIGQGTTDLRYRPQYDKWSVIITVRYDRDTLSAEQIVNLLNRAGFSIGVGEKRPQQKSGDSFGMFTVAR